MSSISPNNGGNRADSGFTLIEVLISIVILAFISVGIYDAITQTYRIRDTLSTEGDFYNGIRLSMNIMQRDLTLVYSPINLLPNPSPSPSPGWVQSRYQPQAVPTPVDPELAQEFDFWGPAIDNTGVRPSRFVGTETKLTFISSSHLRVYKDTPESEFAKITYELLEDDSDSDSQMLVKTENTDVFTLETKTHDPNDRIYALLHGIKKFKYRFYRKDTDTWVTAWDSDADLFKNIYPDIIELTLDVAGPQKLTYEGRYLFRPELPLRALNPSI